MEDQPLNQGASQAGIIPTTTIQRRTTFVKSQKNGQAAKCIFLYNLQELELRSPRVSGSKAEQSKGLSHAASTPENRKRTIS